MKITIGNHILHEIKGVPVGTKVLYPLWHHNSGTVGALLDMPTPYLRHGQKRADVGMGKSSDFLWAYVLHHGQRWECTSKRRKDGPYFRPRGWGSSNFWFAPVRIYAGRKWRWFWVTSEEK